MPSERAPTRSATLCALLLAICTLAAYPFAEIGGNDDFAYVRSAKALAETGHVVYFGWSSAMLGWQLALGALFFKLFGFSFTVARASILLVAAATAFLLQRSFARLGLREGNATFATLTLVLSPLFLPLSFSFMSDIPGLFAIVVCLYLCLRAVQSPAPTHATRWLIVASIASALLGTARQTGWLGVLVIVPSTCWLLRRRVSIVAVASVWIASVGFLLFCLHWFSLQMYATAEGASGMGGVDRSRLFDVLLTILRVPLEIAFFLCPILIAFSFVLVRESKRLALLALTVILAFCAYFVLRPHSYWIGILLAPANSGIGNYVTFRGVLELPAIGARPVVLAPVVRLVVSIICYFAAFACAALLVRRKRVSPLAAQDQPARLTWRQMLVLVVPFTLAYCAFLSIRVSSGIMFDRYLLPLFVVVALIAVRFYQETINPRLPRTCFAVLAVFAAYSIAGTHDMFAVDRARIAAVQQFRAVGLAPTDFYGGFAYDGWTQINRQGYIDVDDIRTPTGIHHLSAARSKFKPCGYWAAKLFPTIQPQYALSYDDASCDPQNTFAPVPYRLWLPPYHGALYPRGVNSARLLPPDTP